MTIHDQVCADASLDQEVDRRRARSANIRKRESYQKRLLTTDETRQSTQAQARYGLRAAALIITWLNGGRADITIYDEMRQSTQAQARYGLRAAALIITWLVLVAITAVGAIWADALRQIGAV